MNLARGAFPQDPGHTAQVVLTQVPVIQQAKLLKLRIPPIFLVRCSSLVAEVPYTFPELDRYSLSFDKIIDVV